MENFIDKPKNINSLACLESEKAWAEKIKETSESYNFESTMVLLGDEEPLKIESELVFQDIPAEQKSIYAETAGRLALGFMNYGSMRAFITEESSRFEMFKLLDKLSGQDLDSKTFLHMTSFHLAGEANTSTSGNSGETFRKILEEAANQAANENSPEVHDGLMNPFHLKDGMEIFKLNKETGELERFSIEVLIEKGAGVVVFGQGADDVEDIIDFNARLSKGEYMKKDGENIFGGLEYLKNNLNIDKVSPGKVIKIDVSHPFDKDQTKFEEVTVVGTNQAELEEKYGNAYLPFLGNASKNKIVLKASIKSSTGEIFNDVNFNSLKIVE
jgi:hypothetical protein